MLKKCAAKYSMEKGKLDKSVGSAIMKAADEVRNVQDENEDTFSGFPQRNRMHLTNPRVLVIHLVDFDSCCAIESQFDRRRDVCL